MGNMVNLKSLRAVGDPWWILDFDTDESVDLINDDWLNSPPDHIRDLGINSTTSVNVPNPLALGVTKPGASAPSPSRLMTVQALLATAPTRYLVANLLPERGVMAFFGPPGAAKTFLAIDCVGALASGRSHWFGRRVAQAPVAFIALEGQGGIRKRVMAWLAHGNQQVPAALRFFTHRLSLLDSTETEVVANEIVSELGLGAVTVIDTLSRAMAGGDENSSIDMTTIIANADLLASITQGPVILVHHTGKDAGKGLRGHSSLLGAVDVAVEVVNDKGNRSWTVRKNKDGEDGGVNAFELVPYTVETDQWGDEVTSCAVRQLLGARKPSLPPLTGKNKIPVMVAIRTALAATPTGIGRDQALDVAVAALTTVLIGRRNTVANSTVNSLVASGHLVISSDMVCLP